MALASSTHSVEWREEAVERSQSQQTRARLFLPARTVTRVHFHTPRACAPQNTHQLLLQGRHATHT